MIAHEKGFKFHAQPQTGAYSCLNMLEDLLGTVPNSRVSKHQQAANMSSVNRVWNNAKR